MTGFGQVTVEAVISVTIGGGAFTVVAVPAIRSELRTIPVCIVVAIAAVVMGFGKRAVSIVPAVVLVAVVWEVRLPEIG